jgi:hypothetical protein
MEVGNRDDHATAADGHAIFRRHDWKRARSRQRLRKQSRRIGREMDHYENRGVEVGRKRCQQLAKRRDGSGRSDDDDDVSVSGRFRLGVIGASRTCCFSAP